MYWLHDRLGDSWLLSQAGGEHSLRRAWELFNYPVLPRTEVALIEAAVFARSLRRLQAFPYRLAAGKTVYGSRLHDSLIERATRSEADYQAVAFEAATANLYLSRPLGCEIIALEPTGTPTPDFEVTARTGAFYIECKTTTTETASARMLRHYMELITTCVWRVVQRQANRGVNVVLRRVPLDREQAARMATDLAALLRVAPATKRVFRRSSRDWTVSVELLDDHEATVLPRAEVAGQALIHPSAQRYMERVSSRSSTSLHRIESHRRHRTRAGALHFLQSQVLVVQSGVAHDWVEGCIEGIRRARRQLPSHAPGVVFAAVPAFTSSKQPATLRRRLKGLFGATRSISSVALCHFYIRNPTVIRRGELPACGWHVRGFTNERAQHPLTDEMIAAGLPLSNVDAPE